MTLTNMVPCSGLRVWRSQPRGQLVWVSVRLPVRCASATVGTAGRHVGYYAWWCRQQRRGRGRQSITKRWWWTGNPAGGVRLLCCAAVAYRYAARMWLMRPWAGCVWSWWLACTSTRLKVGPGYVPVHGQGLLWARAVALPRWKLVKRLGGLCSHPGSPGSMPL